MTFIVELCVSLLCCDLQNYIVSHIDRLQAMVIVEHTTGQFNLYLSDATGVYFSLSLPDIVVEQDSGIDLELVSWWLAWGSVS